MSVHLLEKSPSYFTFSWGILVITRGVVWGSLCCFTAFAVETCFSACRQMVVCKESVQLKLVSGPTAWFETVWWQ